jgi:DNA mismatch repair protein MutS2
VQSTSAETLEYEALRSLLRRYVSSPLGRAELEKIQPNTDRAGLEETLAEAAEAIGYLRDAAQAKSNQATINQPSRAMGRPVRLDFAGLPELSVTIQKLRIEGAGLEAQELFDVITLLERAADAKTILHTVADRFPRLGARGAAIGEFQNLLRAIQGKILPDGSVADDASVALSRLRRDIDRQKKNINESLERFLRAHRDDGILQEEIVTIRNERFVVPVVSGQRRKVDGVIHAASSTGHTLFVEPLETIDLNNELVRLTEEEFQEVHRILRELTESLRAHAPEIRQTLEAMSALEFVFAKARFAADFHCTIPRFGGRLMLGEARHPLLQDVLRKKNKRVEPITLTLDAGCKTLLISGPNTGGKTVTLKTVGLIVLMAQSGLPVPCVEAELPLFEQILADIGDRQSIQESLSTFSAHMSHIREMALDVTPDSLVLLDEIGSATDPEEGGALGVALVEHFRASGAYTLATTHLLALKIYGANTKSVLNASMGFDEVSLEPTYQLKLGLPGKSAGLDIAARLGMPEDIMKRARASLSDRELDIARFLADLHARTERATKLEEELTRERAALQEREKQLVAETAKREAAKLQDLEERYAELAAEFQFRANETIQELGTSKPQVKVAKVTREFREQFESAVLPKTAAPKLPALEVGSRVRLKDIREPATVLRLLSNERIEVQAGFMKMQVTRADVQEILTGTPAPASRLPKGVSYQAGPAYAPVSQELNVIGERAEEARDRVEKFLDDAVMATASRVRIVHGHGMGVLKKTVSDLLARNPHVERFYPATQAEGGAGATIAELKN